MPVLITGDELRRAVESQTFIKHGAVSCAEGVKYDFRLSHRILKAQVGAINADQLSESERARLVIEPGEVVFALTEESLALESDMMVQLTPKRKLSHSGILTIGGLAIDPGYRGRILLGLFNISSTPFPVRPMKKVIGATFHRLVGDEVELETGFQPPTPLEDFPSTLMRVMDSYKPYDIHSLASSIDELRSSVRLMEDRLAGHETWKKDFESALSSLADKLDQEREARRAGQDDLTKAVQTVESGLTDLKAQIGKVGDRVMRGLKWSGGVLGGIVAAVVTGYVLKILGLV